MFKKIGIAAASTLLAVCLVLPALGHDADLLGERRAGPILLGETTLRQAKNWFGEPTSRKIVKIGCVRAVKMRWGHRLTVLAEKYEGKTYPIAEARAQKRTITSSKHGDLTMHTKKGLMVGDPESKVNELYPSKEGHTHKGHTHYLLEQGRMLMVKVVDEEVVEIVVGPYEFC